MALFFFLVPFGCFLRSPLGGYPAGVPRSTPWSVKMLRKHSKRLRIKPGPAKWRDLDEICSFSTTWLDLEPIEVIWEPF